MRYLCVHMQPCCWACNRTKGRSDQDNMVEHARRIVEHELRDMHRAVVRDDRCIRMLPLSSNLSASFVHNASLTAESQDGSWSWVPTGDRVPVALAHRVAQGQALANRI